MLKGMLVFLGINISRNVVPEKTKGSGYISASATISAAEKAGLSVCDYLENLWGQQGETQKVIDQMASCNLFTRDTGHILEVGAGTGRYLEKVLEKCEVDIYESYEVAQDWADYLQSKYPIVSQVADGKTLQETPELSIDLLHAHGVFVYLPFLVSYGYWKEIWRVTKPGGSVVFDIFSENCTDELTVEKWLAGGHYYPCFLSRDYVVSLFEKHGFCLIKTFSNRYGAGISEYLVFRRNNSA